MRVMNNNYALGDCQFQSNCIPQAGKNIFGQPNKNLWPSPEGTAPPPPEEKNPLLKLLMDVSDTQQLLLEDHLLLTNRMNIHRCSDYCLQSRKGKSRNVVWSLGHKLIPVSPSEMPQEL